jgi:uncharacterized protein YwqG
MTPEELDALIESKRKPGIVLQRTPLQTDDGTPGCWLGGEPTLPPEIEWPVFNPEEFLGDDVDIPMHFFAQINLAHLPDVPGLPDIPRKGTLFIFYDPIVAFGPEAYSMGSLETGDGAKLIYVAGDVTNVVPRKPPTFPNLDTLPSDMISPTYQGTTSLPKWPFQFELIDTWPCVSEDPRINGFPDAISSDFLERMDDLADAQLTKLDKLIDRERYLGSDLMVNPQILFGATRRTGWPDLQLENTDPKESVLLFHFSTDEEIKHFFYDDYWWGLWIDRNHLSAGNFNTISIIEDL